MPPVGFEPTISAGERPKTYALDRAATGIGTKFGERLKLLWIFFFCQSPCFSFSDRNMLLSTRFSNPTLCIFSFITSDRVRFLLLCENIFLFPTHLRCFLFPQIFLFLTHFRRLHPHSTFSSSPATFSFQSLMYLISLITHNNCTNFFFAGHLSA